MPLGEEPPEEVRRNDRALTVRREEDGVGRMQVAHPLVVAKQVRMNPCGKRHVSHEARKSGDWASLGDLALDGAVTFERDLGDLLELEPVRLLELLERCACHIHKLAARGRQLR